MLCKLCGSLCASGVEVCVEVLCKWKFVCKSIGNCVQVVCCASGSLCASAEHSVRVSIACAVAQSHGPPTKCGKRTPVDDYHPHRHHPHHYQPQQHHHRHHSSHMQKSETEPRPPTMCGKRTPLVVIIILIKLTAIIIVLLKIIIITVVSLVMILVIIMILVIVVTIIWIFPPHLPQKKRT